MFVHIKLEISPHVLPLCYGAALQDYCVIWAILIGRGLLTITCLPDGKCVSDYVVIERSLILSIF